MEDCSPASSSSTLSDLKGNQHNKDSEEAAVSSYKNGIDDSNHVSQCSSAKQCKKMNDNSDVRSLSYTWKQNELGIDISIKLRGSADSRKKFDATFTSKTANISLSDGETHVIHLYDVIVKEKSKVEIKKGSANLHLVKKQHGLWPGLEVKQATDRPSVNGQEDIKRKTADKNEEKDNMSIKEKLNAVENNDVESDCKNGPEQDVKQCPLKDDKEEKPVYHLDHLKHDFFERDFLLTLQVFTKSLGKDSISINFNSQGFVLKFQTSDAKFLQLHEGTSSDTMFCWTVTTRGELKPDACSFKVKQSVIEMSLRKVALDRWPSLEASVRKNNEGTKANTWLPLNATPGKVVDAVASTSSSPLSTAPSSSSSSRLSGSPDESSENKPSSKKSVLFDEDLNDINLKDKTNRMTSKLYNQNQAGGSAGNDLALSSFGDHLKLKSNSSQDYNKPTAKVQPLSKQMEETAPVVAPGHAGLVNFGNTCFMNCVLQVVANTREFRDYFLDGRFQHEINEDNPLGMKGHLAATFGVLLRWMWSCKRHCWEPRKLKDLISKKNPQFFGFAQHDAHEFLAFLLDGLHEDLNRIKTKPYTETVDSEDRPDEVVGREHHPWIIYLCSHGYTVVAAEAWAQYKQRNDSVVVDMFQGQYKSKLVCPNCGKVSITFDPFLYLSVPLPKKTKIIPVTFMWKESYKKPQLYQVQVAQDSTIENLLEILSQKTLVPMSDIRVFEAYRGKIHKFFFAGSSLAHVDVKDIIIACEVLSDELAGEEVLEFPVIQRTLSPTELPTRCAFCHKLCMEGMTLKRCTKCYKVGYCDHSCQRNHWNVHKPQCSTSPEPIGCPFIVSVPASRATFRHLVKVMEGYARFSVNLFQPPVKSTTDSSTPVNPSTSSSHTPAASNLSSSLSQSCSSLNSLDSLSSASSTCTLTGDQSDPMAHDDAAAPPSLDASASSSSIGDCDNVNVMSSTSSLSSCDTTLVGGDNPVKVCSVDSGIDTTSVKSERLIPTSQVMGVQARESERDKATPTFFIKPVTMEGVGVKGAERLEDKGDVPLELSSHKFLSMDWRNNGRQPSCVLVQSKELESKKMDDPDDINNASNKPTLYQCLELFTEPEILKPEEAWYCPTCKKHVEASKQMAIWSLPHTLIIQLKRFSFQNFLMRSKIKKHVDFPTRGLDLRQFCAGSHPPDSPPIYDLYGVANHHGLLIGGHYTSFVRCADDKTPSGPDEVGWRLCDDSRVTPIPNEKSVVTPDAYLLFYRRRGMAATIGSSTTTTASNNNNVNPPRVIPLGMKNVAFEDDAIDSDEGGDGDGIYTANYSRAVEEVEFNEVAISSNLSVAEGLGLGSAIKSPYFNDRVNTDDLNQSQRSGRGKGDGLVIGDRDAVLAGTGGRSEEEEEGDGDDDDAELREKGDREKEVYDKKEDDYFYSDDDDDDRERSLIIDTGPDLGYTDMEAVD